MNYLLDTNVISALRKPAAYPNVMTWFAGSEEESLYLSVVTLGEIRKGIALLRRENQNSAAALEKWFDALRGRYAKHLLPVDGAVAETWGELLAIDAHHAIDALLAATATVHHMTLVTRNVKHMQSYPVKLLKPFDS